MRIVKLSLRAECNGAKQSLDREDCFGRASLAMTGTNRHCERNEMERSNPLKELNLCKNSMVRGGYIYILTNKNNTVLYTGVTSNLRRRVFEHKEKYITTSFTAKYNIDKLVYFEPFLNIEEAIAREKQIKGGSRAKKEALIKSFNPEWKDLFNEIEDYM